jgi:4-hydroxybenzoyl-CoA reductase subunit beta
MIATKFEYRSPRRFEEAVSAFQEFEGRAVYLGGGTDLTPRIKLGLEKPRAVIDLKRVSSGGTVEDQGTWIRIGALAPLFDLKHNSLVVSLFPAFRQSLEATSCETLQMRGAIGGNLLQNTRCLFYNQSEFWRKSKGFCLKMGGDRCNAVPGAKRCFANYCSDNAPALCALSTEIELLGPNGSRRLALEDLYSNESQRPFQLEHGEILTAIYIPKRKTIGGYEKLRLRGAIDYPLLGVAFSSDAAGSHKLAVGAIGPRPYVVTMREASVDAAVEAAVTASGSVTPVGNTVLNPDYRKRMIPVLAGRLVKKVMEAAR